ncbi:MAG: ribonuclease [Actinomycetota bacterium]|jgi:ribonuclease-3
MGEPLEELCDRLGHRFSDPSLLQLALVHRSWLAENSGGESNERLEFLGDAVLGLVIADVAYQRLGDSPEGKLSDLRQSVVNATALGEVARTLRLGDYLILGRGEDAAGGRDKTSILSDALEAVIGAVYLDAGQEVADAMVRRLLHDAVEHAIPNLESFDFKTRLQELAAQRDLGVPHYATHGEGPDHDKVFTATVRVGSELFGPGTGRTKKAAEQVAAQAAIDHLRTLDEPTRS